MSKEMQEIEKIEKYVAENNTGIHYFLYQMMAVVIFSGFIYRYLISNLVEIDIAWEKDVLTIFMIFPLFMLGVWHYFKERKSQKKQNQIVFEKVNVFDFISKFETDPLKQEITYMIVMNKIFENLNRFNKINNSDLVRFKEEMNNLTCEYHSLEVYKYMKLVS
jgi:hypothetical protein